MSYYGHKTFARKFSVVKQFIEAGTEYRFGGGTQSSIIVYNTVNNSIAPIDASSTVKIINAPSDANCILVILLGNLIPNTTVTFSDIEIVDVANTWNLPSSKTAVVMEGLMTAEEGAVQINGDEELNYIEGGEAGKVLSGNCKLIVFSTSQTVTE